MNYTLEITLVNLKTGINKVEFHLKACGIPSGYVEAHAIRFPSIKGQVRIYFNKMIVASNLKFSEVL